MIIAIAVLVALSCVAASARRLWFATHSTTLHPLDVIAWLGKEPKREKLTELRAIAEREPSAEWERDLLEALSHTRADARIALVNEQLTELDIRMQRWARVPRVCASVATSVGILLGTLVLRNGLANAPDLSGDLGELFVRDVLGDAISVAAWGIVGTAFCIGAHSHAKKLTRKHLEDADKMIEKLEEAAGPTDPGTEGRERARVARAPD